MDANQFAQFFGAVTNRDATEQADRQAEKAREKRRRKLTTQIKAVKPCDGSSIPLVRDWFLDMEIARTKLAGAHLEESTLKLVSATLQGAMWRFFEGWQIAYVARPGPLAHITWAMTKEVLRAAYLTIDEGEYLKNELETLKQSNYETTGAYGRRFMEAANLAYPANTRNATVASQILEKYLGGFRSRTLVRRIIQEGRPTTLEEAASFVETYTAQDEHVKRLWARQGPPIGRQEEPMEVNLIARGAGAARRDQEARGAGAARYDADDLDDSDEEDYPTGERHYLDRINRLEEIAMVAMVGRNPHPAPAARIAPQLDSSLEQMAGAITKLTNQMSGLHKEMDKLKGQTIYVAPTKEGVKPSPAAPGTKFAQNKWIDGVPICFECKELGHKGKECPIRIARLTGTSSGRAGNGNASQ